MNGQFPPIAIVGMACRFPKGLEDLETLWRALKTRFSAIDTVPADRWTADRYYSSNEIAKGKSYIRRGGFLHHDVSKFDATFFGISPRDAENMDPQQRLLLEVVWEAFENAGLVLPNYSGKKVGVYVGGFMLDHMITQMSTANRSQINQHTAAGMMMTMLSNRISHTFDFRGPSLSIDTACSSSLVAFHYACQDLWRGASEVAVVGGANTILRPEYPMGMCKGHFLSRDGECKSFDARGDGYGRGEGAAAILLKPLEKAIADGDHVLSTVIGTGTNQDGRTPGISMPCFAAQKSLIEEICAKYEIDPREIRYVECHGTGTAVGDPIEARAVGETYGKARKETGKVVIGSIKSNIGHLEAAAGVAGVVKAVLTALHRQATPLANLQQPNPAIAFEELNLRLSDDNIQLGTDDESFCVAINSFGYGGSNAHVILRTPEPAHRELNEQPGPKKSSLNGQARKPANRRFPYLLPISGRSEKAVAALAGKYAELLRNGLQLENLLYTASLKRAHLSHRAVVKGNDLNELLQGLDALAQKSESKDVVSDTEPYLGHRKPVFVFTGMGPQWWGMGQELYREDEIYRSAVEEADQEFQKVAGFSILAEMLKSEQDSQITQTIFAQPANLLIQIGLFASLKAAGIEPGAVVGHSVGELASAYAAGVLSLHDVMTVCFHRSQLQAKCIGAGGMLAVGLSHEKALALLADCEGRVSIAAINGPANVTLAGDVDLLHDIATQLKRDDVFHRMLEVEVPYHSPQMEPIMEPLANALSGIRPQQPRLPLYSTVTAQRVEGIAYGSDYWPQNIRQPVYFAPAIHALLQEGYNTFVEIGPHPVLATSLKECIKEAGKDCRTLYTLRRNTAEVSNVQRAVMGIFAAGCDINWQIHNGQGHFISIPNYAWQRDRFWLENDRAVQDRIASINHPILGIQEAPGSPVWRNDFDHEPLLYLRDHVVAGTPILPAAGYIEALLELAMIQFADASGFSVRNLDIYSPMLITVERGLDCVTSYEPFSQLATIRSLENGRLGTGQVHVTGKLGALQRWLPRQENLAAVAQECYREISCEDFYVMLKQLGLMYGPAFQTVKQLHVAPSGGKALARIELDASLASSNYSQYLLHPTLLDACFQSLIAMFENSDTTYLPTGLAEMCVYVKSSPTVIYCLSETTLKTPRFIECNLTLMDDAGNVIATIRSMRLTAASKRERTDQFGDRVKRQVLQYEWKYGENLSEPKRLGHWLVIGNADQFAGEVTRGLENFGSAVMRRVQFGASFQEVENNVIVRPGSLEDAHKVLEDCGELNGIVFMHGLAATPDSNDPTGELALKSLVAFSQALIKQNAPSKPRVYVVTQAAFAVQEHEQVANPGQTSINGFARVAFNELEGLRFSTVDLPTIISPDVLETLGLELLCDDVHDEIAIRGGLRLVSELVDSKHLSDDRIAYAHLDDQHPVLVRPLRPDIESIGTARVLATSLNRLGPKDICVRVEATSVPANLLLDPSADSIQQPGLEIVGEVLEVGAEVDDLIVGARVCGFGPADLASHLVGPRHAFHIVSLPANANAANLLSTLALAMRAERAVDSLDLASDETAIIQVSSLGLVIAQTLQRKGISVTLLSDDPASIDPVVAGQFPIYSCCPEGMAAAVAEQTEGRGFSILVAGMFSWMKEYDLRLVRIGGAIIDTDETASPMTVSAHIQDVARTDLRVLLRRPMQFQKTLRKVVDGIHQGTIPTLPCLEVTIADLAWRKLPVADTRSTLVLTYETRGQDLPVVQQDELQFNSQGTYLITGGFGGLGQKTAEWLVANGAKNLVLTGRSTADSPERQAFVAKLEGQGVKVLTVACDTSVFARLREVFAQIERDMAPLKGVFHSGAVIMDQPIAEIDPATFEKVMRSKALGAWNLHLLTREMDLEQFVLYSSLANLVGNSRQAAYSAANGFLNGLAHYRRSLGLAATAVNWGAIADVGVVAKDEKLEQFLRYTGLRGINSEEGLQVLQQALARNVTQFGVTVITSWADWARFETRGATSPRFASLIAADSQGKDNSLRDALVEELSKLEHADQVELLATLIVEIIASVLKSDVSSVPIDRAINLLGVDSLMATEIQLLLDNKLGVSVSILELIGDTTIRSLAGHAVKTLVGDGAPLAAAAV